MSCEYLREFSKKFETVLMEYSGAGGKLIHEKNQKQKISWHCPFKYVTKLGHGGNFDSSVERLCGASMQGPKNIYVKKEQFYH